MTNQLNNEYMIIDNVVNINIIKQADGLKEETIELSGSSSRPPFIVKVVHSNREIILYNMIQVIPGKVVYYKTNNPVYVMNDSGKTIDTIS